MARYWIVPATPPRRRDPAGATVTDHLEDALGELARLAADLGPALAPAGHHELLQAVTQAVRELFGAAACSLALVDEAGERLEFVAAAGAGAELVVGMRIPASRGIAGWVLASGQPVELSDAARDPRFARDVAERTGYVPRSILAMPVEGSQQTLGVLEVLDRGDTGGLGADQPELLALFARQAALAVEQARVFADLGRALLQAAAVTAEGASLRDALTRAAQAAPRSAGELAELAARFHTLAQLGPEERQAATDLLGVMVAYAERRRSWW
jgi:GAF domain-containing protein